MLVISIITFVVCISIIGFIYFKNTENSEKDEIYSKDVSETGEGNHVTVDVIMSTLKPTGARILVENHTFESSSKYIEYDWAKKYKLQKKNDNKWEDLEIKNTEEIIYNNVKNTIPYKNFYVLDVDWSNLYGTLSNGTYRFIQYTSNTNDEFYSNEFTLPKKEVEIPADISPEYRERYTNVTLDVLLGTVTSKGATVLVTDKNGKGNNYREMGFSDAFELQKKEGNKWKDLKITAEFEFGGGPIYSLAPNVPDPAFGFATFQTDFTYLYDELKPGTYRVIKGGELSENRFYSNEFTINK